MALTVGIATTGCGPAGPAGVCRRSAPVGVARRRRRRGARRGQRPRAGSGAGWAGLIMLRVRYLDRANVAMARNTVLAEARHDTILFTD